MGSIEILSDSNGVKPLLASTAVGQQLHWRKSIMANKHDDKNYTSFHFRENELDLKRQLHSITVQDRLGVVRTLTGDELPRWIRVNTGKTHTGANSAQVLLAPESITSPLKEELETKLFRFARDVFFLAVGFFAILMLRFFAELFGWV